MTAPRGLRSLLGWADRRDPLGSWGERVAARRLRRAGHRVLARNVTRSVGEADLLTLAPDKKTLVIVEVKARRIGSGAGAPPPEASITAAKRRRLLLMAQAIAKERRWTGPVRIDVVAVERPDKGKATIRVHESAVTL